MSTPDEVAKLREIKRLLDRIQQLPHIAAAGARNGVHNGFFAGSHHSPPEDDPPAEEASNGVHGGYYAPSPYAPAPAANGAFDGLYTDSSDVDAKPYRNGVHNGYYADPPPPPSLQIDPEPPPVPARAHSLAFEEAPQAGESRALVPVQASGAVGISPWVFVTATAVNTIIAAVLAVVITLGVGHRESGEVAPAATPGKEDARAAGKPKHLAEPAPVRPIDIIPIGSRNEPLRLEAMKPSRFPLRVRPEEAMQGSYILVLTGLPENATLSGATRMGSDSWLVAPGALRQLEIAVPEWSASVIELKVELRHANGTLAGQGKAWLAVPPPKVAQGAKLDETGIKDLLRRGDRLLGRGDVAAARAVYERAAALGSAQAALALGSTYDPGRLWSLGVFGMVGNKERARQWYQRADQLGHPEAKERLKALRY